MRRYGISLVLPALALVSTVGCRNSDTEFEDHRGQRRSILLTGEAPTGAMVSAEALDPAVLDDVLAPLDGPDPGAEALPPEMLPEEPPVADEDEISPAEARVCTRLVGVSAERIKIVGNQPQATITAGNAVAIKVAGNQSRLDLSLAGGAEDAIAGVCLFVTGNQAEVLVTANINLGTLVYVGRGNLSQGDVSVGEGYEMRQSYVDLSGNQAKLRLTGGGSFLCPTPRQRGHESMFDCQ